MSPEIARRCQSCGASVRRGAAFCPECGYPLKKDVADARTTGEISAAELKRREIESGGLEQTIPYAGVDKVVEHDSLKAESSQSETAALNEERNAAAAATRAAMDGAPPGTQRAGEELSAKRARVTMAARAVVEEKVRPRVERVRQASNVVLDEAAVDPSLRFVLIAALLFLIFVVLLLISNSLG